MGPAAERSPTWEGSLLKQPLGAAALGDTAAVSFIVHVFPPHKSGEGIKNKREKAEGWKRDPGRGCRWGKGTQWVSEVLEIS